MEIDQYRIQEILFFGSAEFDAIGVLRCDKVFPNVGNRLVEKVMHLDIFEVSGFGIEVIFIGK